MFSEYPDNLLEKAKCTDFLQNYLEMGVHTYRQQLQEIANRERKVLEIAMDDIIKFKNDIDFASNISRNTPRYLSHFEEVADELIPTPDLEIRDQDVFDILKRQRLAHIQQATATGQQPAALGIPTSVLRRFEVSIVPSCLDKPRKLREIKAQDIGHLVVVKGMVTRVSEVRPHISVATYTCDVCGCEVYQDVAGTQFMPIVACPSQLCKDNKSSRRLSMQTRGSKFVKYQELRLQELPDQVPVGHIPRSMTVHCRGELTRKCGPGDVVTVSGIFTTVKFGGFKAIRAGLQADTFVAASSIVKQKLSYEDLGMVDNDDMAVQLGTDPYHKLASSIAPEIFGHDDVKKALLLQLVGGVSRSLSDGMKIRGDVNICLMGDPGVAKSQLLKYIATVAPRGVYTTGKGSSGVGLTAAVIRDNLTGEMALEGGALVLADMGICCIDEFDKMDETDRTAIHEVMEQQTISIAKAGITTTLNARAAVLAAANPLYGRYNKRKSISENVDLPNSLLSRFDLLFLIIDKAERDTDLALSKHVLHVHRHLCNPGNKSNVSSALIKQYIAAARTVEPTIPRTLTSYIVDAYVDMRATDGGRQSSSKSNDQAVMTARQLLSILRLSQSLARLRFATTVDHNDVDEAIRLIRSSKSSLEDDQTGAAQEDVSSVIYTTIRDFCAQRNTDTVEYGQIEQMVLKKGYSSQQLQACIHEYQALSILHLSLDRNYITMDG